MLKNYFDRSRTTEIISGFRHWATGMGQLILPIRNLQFLTWNALFCIHASHPHSSDDLLVLTVGRRLLVVRVCLSVVGLLVVQRPLLPWLPSVASGRHLRSTTDRRGSLFFALIQLSRSIPRRLGQTRHNADEQRWKHRARERGGRHPCATLCVEQTENVVILKDTSANWHKRVTSSNDLWHWRVKNSAKRNRDQQ